MPVLILPYEMKPTMSMDTIYSITSKFITPAVILNDRIVQVFAAILRAIKVPAPWLETAFAPEDSYKIRSILNFGGRNKFRRKSRPGLQLS